MNRCLLCEQQIDRRPTWQGLLGVEKKQHLCVACSKSFQRADIIEEGEIFDRVHSLYDYNEAMREFFHQYKFLQDIALAAVFADDLRTILKGRKVVVPIPMHPLKRVERTFAHVDELLTRASISFHQLLDKSSTDVMGEKTREERLAMEPLFKLKEEAVIEPITYTIVDDIYTTGTTLKQAAAVLKESGAARVEAVTLIRA
ncbi:amidophosphoribosyltransferase [Sporosarcina sp. NCCP-2222]|uniref:ComF family protein n=1 Tax=Sporosarcina sp. NCCP-2222 TaxID=2935073 RepID=UPI0020816148|nr:phosphoribosyltransferase family protein [Sporosarcina sp. NCCP-2222]GKV56703.1 amidophosphoribosyltransferase [Sporosarcina sp. NCCP-2222]